MGIVPVKCGLVGEGKYIFLFLFLFLSSLFWGISSSGLSFACLWMCMIQQMRCRSSKSYSSNKNVEIKKRCLLFLYNE